MATDNLGRNIDAGMAFNELKGMIQSLAKGRMGEAKPFNTTKTTANLPQDLIGKFSESIKKVEQLVKAVNNFMKGSKENKKNTSSSMGKNAEVADKAIKKLADKGLKKGSIYTHDIYLEKLQKLMYLQMKKQTAVMERIDIAPISAEILLAEGELAKVETEKATNIGGKEKGRREQRLDDIEKVLGAGKLAGLVLASEELERYTNSIGHLQEALYGFRATDVLFKDMIAAERQFTVDSRQIAFEIAGATKESRGLQRSFEDIGKTTAETGFDRSATQDAYLKALKKGAKEQKVALSITKNQLNTERMIGVSAGSLEETFSNMSLQMGMNNSQMAQFGRGVQDVAKNTGVTGDNLANAVKRSESIMKNMRNIGTLNAQAASNVVGLMASAEKFGVGDFAQEIANTLSQGMSGFMQADQKMQIILGQALGHNAKLMEQMRNGTIMQTKEGMRGLAEGMENTLARISGGRVRTAKDFAKLSADEKMILNTQIKAATGKTAVEFLQMTKSLEEQAKPLSEKLAKIAEQKKKNLNAEEKATLIEQERSLKVSTGLSALTQLDEELKQTDGGIEGMQKALSKLQTSEMAKELEAMGVDTKDPKAMGQATIEQTLKGLNEGLKKVGQSSVDIGADRIAKAMSGDEKELEKIMEELNAGNQKLAIAQRDATDPTTQLRRSMEKLNETLRGATQSAISSMMNSVFGESLGILTTLADVGGQAAGLFAQGVMNYHSLKTLTSDVMPLFQAGGAFSGVATSFGGAIAGLVAPMAIAAAVVAGAYGSFSQAAKSAEKAGEIFGKSMEDITTAEYYAAKGAGFLTGWLNTLTFGIFDSWIGSTGVITKALAQFNKMIPIVSIIMGLFDAIFGAIWGIVTSIKDVVVGAFEMIYYAISPIGEIFTIIGNTISDAIGPLFNFGSKLSETGTIFQMFASAFGYIGKVIRNILVGIGKAVGFVVTAVIKVLTPALILIGKMIGGLAAVLGFFFERVYDYFRGVFLFFEGLFNLDFNKMGQGLWNSITNALLLIPSLIFNLFKYAFSLIYIELPKALLGVTKMIFDAIWNGLSYLTSNDWVGAIFQPFLQVLKPLYSAFSDLYRVFEELWTVLGSIFEPFNELFAEFSKLFGFTGEASGWMDILKTAVQGVAKVIGMLIEVALLPIEYALFGLSNTIKLIIPLVKFVSDLFTVGIVQAFKNLGKNLWNAVVGIFQPMIAFLWSLGESLLSPFKWLADVLVGHSIVPDLVSKIIMFFATLPIEIFKGLVKLPFMFIDWIGQMFGMIPGAIGESMYSAASGVGLGWLVDSMLGTKGGKSISTETAEAAISKGEKTITTDTAVISDAAKLLADSLILGSEMILLSASKIAMSVDNTRMFSPTQSLMSAATSFFSPTVASTATTKTIGEKAEIEATSINATGNEELGVIASSSEEQVDKLEEVIDLLSRMVDYLTSENTTGSGRAEKQNTMLNSVPSGPPKFYKWSIGKHFQTSALGVTNIANV